MLKFPAWIEEVLDQLHPHDIDTEPILETLTRINGLLKQSIAGTDDESLADRIRKETTNVK